RAYAPTRTFADTVPFGEQPARRTTAAAPAPAAAAQEALPRWIKGFVIGGVLLSLAMPASVMLSRSMLVQAALAGESSSRAAMICTAGDARAVDGSSLLGWLFSGSYFSCGDWETREARQQRERDQYEANYMAREKARQRY
ncbi:hypothetical protein DBR42_16020, partial [Pelomonas sp. HMWF004]